MSDEFGTATHDTIIAQARRMLARIGVEATDWGVHQGFGVLTLRVLAVTAG
jgi:hypothetical protein